MEPTTETTDAPKTNNRTKAPVATQTDLAPKNPPKPNNMTPVTPKHNATLELLQVEGQVVEFRLRGSAGGKLRIRAHLVAKVQQGMPKSIQASAKGLWQAAGAIEGKNATHMTLGRAWAIQNYRFEVAKAAKIKDAPTWECEVVGNPKLSIVGQKDIELSWVVEFRLSGAQMRVLDYMLEAKDFELTTRDLQTEI